MTLQRAMHVFDAPRDPAELHGRPCRCCADQSGRIHVTIASGLTTITCDRCGSSARAICASYDVPLQAVLGVLERAAKRVR